MDHAMTEAEITRAMALLEEEGQAEVEKVQLGKWIVVSENGVLTVQSSKATAIREALSHHSQSRQHCKIKRLRAGAYDLAILDIDEDPAERFYHQYFLTRIDEENILRFRGLAMVPYLPEWYFIPYSLEYRQFFTETESL